MTNFIFYIMYIPGNFITIALLHRFGIKVSIIIGVLFLLIGSWARLFLLYSGSNFTPYYVGATLAAFGQPFLMNLPSKIASNWFGDRERAIATAVGALSPPIGSVISFVLPQAFVSEADFDDVAQAQKHICFYILVQTMLVSLFCIPALSFIREEPLSPPSVVANDTNNGMGFKEGIKELVSNKNFFSMLFQQINIQNCVNKNFVLLFICFNLVYAIYSSMGAIYANLAAQYNYSLESISMSCLVFLVGGIFNSFILGSMLDKYQNYRKMVIFISILSIVTTLMHFGTLPFKNAALESLIMLIIGASVIPITSVSLVFSVELTFPVPEALTNGMMITSSLLFGTATGFLGSYLAQYSPMYSLALWTSYAVLALIISFFIQEDLRRLQLDDVKNSEYIEEEEVRRQSFEQREVFLKESGLETDLIPISSYKSIN